MHAGKLVSFFGFVTAATASLATAAPPDAPRRGMAPQIIVGPNVEPANVLGPELPAALFTCQLGTAPPGSQVCYDPFQIRTAYGIDKLISAGYSGAGQTIVIIDAYQSATLPNDLDTFSANYGLPLVGSGFFTQIAPDGLGSSDTDWAGEISLDVEWAHAIAPRAKITLVLAKTSSQTDVVSALKYAVDNHLGDVISMSFGANESCVGPAAVSAYHDVFVAATQKGITLIASSADWGAAQLSCDGITSWVKAVSFPASDPLVTSVGGTELHAANYCLLTSGCDPATQPAAGTYESEIVWNESLPRFSGDPSRGSSGGGFSVLFQEPPYQEGTLPGGSGRGLPDVAYSAAVYDGVLVSLAGHWTVFGGTSAGAPQLAAITAIANQRAGRPLGFLNAALYQIGMVKRAYPASFHDVQSGNNSVVELGSIDNTSVSISGFTAGTGWDATTGTGSPVDGGLVNYLTKYVSPGDGDAAIATSTPKPHAQPPVPGQMKPH
jgi:subtilase family serine protease